MKPRVQFFQDRPSTFSSNGSGLLIRSIRVVDSYDEGV